MLCVVDYEQDRVLDHAHFVEDSHQHLDWLFLLKLSFTLIAKQSRVLLSQLLIEAANESFTHDEIASVDVDLTTRK